MVGGFCFWPNAGRLEWLVSSGMAYCRMVGWSWFWHTAGWLKWFSSLTFWGPTAQDKEKGSIHQHPPKIGALKGPVSLRVKESNFDGWQMFFDLNGFKGKMYQYLSIVFRDTKVFSSQYKWGLFVSTRKHFFVTKMQLYNLVLKVAHISAACRARLIASQHFSPED
jgi:hypothetical protein